MPMTYMNNEQIYKQNGGRILSPNEYIVMK